MSPRSVGTLSAHTSSYQLSYSSCHLCYIDLIPATISLCFRAFILSELRTTGTSAEKYCTYMGWGRDYSTVVCDRPADRPDRIHHSQNDGPGFCYSCKVATSYVQQFGAFDFSVKALSSLVRLLPLLVSKDVTPPPNIGTTPHGLSITRPPDRLSIIADPAERTCAALRSTT